MKILIIGPRSGKYVTGLSVALDMFIEGLQEKSISFRVIDSSTGASDKRSGVFSIVRAFGIARVLIKYLIFVPRACVVYLPIGDSKVGFIRDAFIILVAAALRRRIVLHFHGGGYRGFYEGCGRYFQAFINYTLNHAHVIVILGQSLRDQFYFLSGYNKPDIHIVPNGLPSNITPRLKPRKLRNQKPVRLLYLSNMIASKGYLEVLDAVHILVERENIQVRCDFAGEFLNAGLDSAGRSPEQARHHYFEVIGRYNIENNVRYHGVVSGSKKFALLNNADIFILPTRYPGEGQPISIVEALSQGIPVISTAYRAIPDQIINRDNGILLDDVTGAHIADAVEEIINDPACYERMSARALEIFREDFTKEKYVDKLLGAVLGRDNDNADIPGS